MQFAVLKNRLTLQHRRLQPRVPSLGPILLVLAACAMVVLGPWGARAGEPEIVARVNGEPVTRAELQRLLDASVARERLQQEFGGKDPEGRQLERLALQKLIHRRLILQEAARRNITVTEQELDQAIITLRSSFEDLRSFGVWMKEQGLDDRSLIETLRAEMLTSRTLAALVEDVKLTDQQVQDYYQGHQEELQTAGDVRLRIIVVKDKASAEEILALLRKGTDFSAMARARSMGFRAAQGGDTGWVDSRMLPPPLRKAVGILKDREIGGPLQVGENFQIVGLVGRRPPRTKSLAEARPEIEQRLLPARQEEAVQAWLREQKKNGQIEVLLQSLVPE